ncbi:hypothetical protein HJC10_09485 [Corallococcus exiguus]|uniref:hypothetical protein n=1 Tax=Corallococcus TaxID=83461 RepID=UPI000EC5EE82|nr:MULTISPECIES: hypothetical protein [Corallococcus]MBN8470744.1 hypothetical protein [Corallococcus exiguus]NNB89898.1 hypothetical protein [Corallococcus exiguus]NNB94471.1 hypothetical protein [Corallococcus exiguus]NNC03077.1 hypothetical protein [Corallococcus exiguus]NPC47383.1 hypothetical protein [Corallococcus exiguus]
MATRKKSDTAHKPGFAKDRVERGLEADDTKPLYADDAKHSTEEQKFAFDSDAPVGGDRNNPQSVLDDVDDEEREERGRLKAEARQEENEPTRE